MNRRYNSLLLTFLLGGSMVFGRVDLAVSEADRQIRGDMLEMLQKRAQQEVLPNGMNVICIPSSNTNKVAVGMLVKAGFADEKSDQYGIAHILEHMVFKSTTTRKEGDLDRLAKLHGLGTGGWNAHTFYDHTFYYFNTDSANWKVFGDVVSDTLLNLQIREEELTSELAAIAQEIKLRKMDQNTLGFGDLFPFNHPYSHLGVGYKEEVFTYTPAQIMAFYEQHYTPDRSTFIVCGNVNPAEVFEYARTAFASFTRSSVATVQPTVQPFYSGIGSVTKVLYHPQLYRSCEFTWLTPPQSSPDAVALDYVAYALNKRLSHKWTQSTGWCLFVGVGVCSLKQGGALNVYFRPQEGYYDIAYEQLVNEEIADIMQNGLTQDELQGKFATDTSRFVDCLEDPLNLMQILPFASGSDMDLFTHYIYLETLRRAVTQDSIKGVAQRYLRPTLLSKEIVLPLPEQEQPAWVELQNKVAQHEAQLLASRSRGDTPPTTSYADTSRFSQPQDIPLAPTPVFESVALSNGLTVHFAKESVSPRCSAMMIFKDAERYLMDARARGKGFVAGVFAELVLDGNAEYTHKQLDARSSAMGITLQALDSGFLCRSLKNNMNEALRLLRLSLDSPTLAPSTLDRKKMEKIEMIRHSQNELHYRMPRYFSDTVYRNVSGTFSEAETISQIQTSSSEDVERFLAEFRNPHNVEIVIVGDFEKDEAVALAEKHFGSLAGTAPKSAGEYVVPLAIDDTASGHVEVANENSYVVAMRPTCLEDEQDTPALLLLKEYLEQQLFAVRERTGLFYGMGVIARPGAPLIFGEMCLIVPAVPGNVAPIMQEMQGIIQRLHREGMSQQTLEALKREQMRIRGKYVTTVQTITVDAAAALRRNKPFDYVKHQEELMQNVTLEQMESVIARYFNPETWSFVTLGRTI